MAKLLSQQGPKPRATKKVVTSTNVLKLNLRMEINNDVFGKDLQRRLDQFEDAVNKAAIAAATEANKVSRAKARGLRPPSAPRKGRSSAPGALARNIRWSAREGEVFLDRALLDKKVPWWVAQEIGTGKQAVVKQGDGVAQKAGRPSRAAMNQPGGRNVRVKSQKGRYLPGHLAFADGPQGLWTPPMAGRRDQQLHLIRRLKGVPFGPPRRGARLLQTGVKIRNEIKPKGFIQSGAREGFRDYRNDVVAAARATLAKRKV